MTEQKKIRLFAAFQNESHKTNSWNELLDTLNGSQKSLLCLYMGMLDSTMAEGYGDEKDTE